MERNLSLFNQINSLSYWLLLESNYKSSVTFDAEEDSYFISIKKGSGILYTHRINSFSKKNKRFLQFELSCIVNNLLMLKDSITLRNDKSA